MNRSLYVVISLGIFVALSAMLQSVIYLLIGPQLYFLESFVLWYSCSTVALFAWLLITLKYYHYKNYKAALWTLVVNLIVSVVQVVIVYRGIYGDRSVATYFIPLTIILLVTSIANASTLFFSRASERKWLKIEGLVSIVLGVLILIAVVLSRNSTIPQWLSLVASLTPFLATKNFIDELKVVNGSGEPVYAMGAIVAVLGIFIVGTQATNETREKMNWEAHLSQQAITWNRTYETTTHKGFRGQSLQYKLIKPVDYDSTKSYPFVVCLPYGGSIEGCPPAQLLITENIRKKFQSFLFVPTCPDGKGWGGVLNYPTIDTLVFETIDSLKAEFNSIDEKKIYVTGVSRGGYGSWHFITTRPDMFAAAIPVCGAGNPELASKLNDVDVWAFHGEVDRNVLVDGSRNMIAAMKAAGKDPKYTEFKGSGHNIWDQVTGTPGMLDWLFQQEKK